MKVVFLFFVHLTQLTFAQEQKVQEQNPNTQQRDYALSQILEDLQTEAKIPHIFDFRAHKTELGIVKVSSFEANNFENGAGDFALILRSPFSWGDLLNFVVRRMSVQETATTRKLGDTPYSQDALVNRYEIGLLYGFLLMEGRSISKLVHMGVNDFEHRLHFVLGAHHSHANQEITPTSGDKIKQLPGQNPRNPTLVAEASLSLSLYTQAGIGFLWEFSYQRPFGGGGDINHWLYLSGGILWAL